MFRAGCGRERLHCLSQVLITIWVDLGGVEPLCVEDFPAQSAFEAFVVIVLPRPTRVDLDRFTSYLSQDPLISR